MLIGIGVDNGIAEYRNKIFAVSSSEETDLFSSCTISVIESLYPICFYNESFGFTETGDIFVDRGCSGTFVIHATNETIECHSLDFYRNVCELQLPQLGCATCIDQVDASIESNRLKFRVLDFGYLATELNGSDYCISRPTDMGEEFELDLVGEDYEEKCAAFRVL